MGILPSPRPRRFGPTRNPWDTERTPGGSSGGSAAAVAAGMVPLAHANDGGGSTRIPAACCGLVGLKPQRGRISLAPEVGDSFLVQDGVLTRTVAETAALLDVLAGYEPGDMTWAPPPDRALRGTAAHARRRACASRATRTPPLQTGVDEQSARAAERPQRCSTTLGHDVEEVDAALGGARSSSLRSDRLVHRDRARRARRRAPREP